MIVFYQKYHDVVMSKLAFCEHFLDVQTHKSKNLKVLLNLSATDTYYFVNSLEEVRNIISTTPSFLGEKILYLNFEAFPRFSDLSQKIQQNWYACNTNNNSLNVNVSFFLNSLQSSTLDNISRCQTTNKNFFTEYQPNLNLIEATNVTKPKNEMAYLASLHQPRAFNSITFNSQTVQKRSSDIEKMKSEKNWYSKAEEWYPLHIPKLVSSAEGGYEIERIHGFPLSQIYFSGSQDFRFWEEIINYLIDTFQRTCFSTEATNPCRYNEQIIAKNTDRLASYNNELQQLISQPIYINGEEYDVSCEINQFNQIIMNTAPCQGFVHGDPCLSNIMYNPISENLFFIDPRGYFGDDHSSIFDSHYDVAKLHHSMFGCYEAITAGNYDLRETDVGYNFSVSNNAFTTELEQVFDKKTTAAGYNLSRVKAISKSFFFSMIPLHYESSQRQLALLLNGLEMRL